MATSGTYNFSMDIDEVIEEAMEMIGGEATLGNEPRSARRSINLLLQDWQNRGIQLWTVGTTTVTVTTSVTSYVLSDANIDVLEAEVNRNDTDVQLERISMEEYLKVPRKGQTGRPTQFAVRRERDQSRVYLWPIPENNTDAIKFETVKYFQDVSKSSQTADISRRFYPCLTAGTAYFMSMKRPGVDAGRIQMIKGEYEERLLRAQEEDRERASMFVLPGLR